MALQENRVLCQMCEKTAQYFFLKVDAKSRWIYADGRANSWKSIPTAAMPFCDACMRHEASLYPIINMTLEDGEEAVVSTLWYVTNQLCTEMKVFESIPPGAKVMGTMVPQATADWMVLPLVAEYAALLSKHADLLCDENGGPYNDLMACLYSDLVQYDGLDGWLEGYMKN